MNRPTAVAYIDMLACLFAFFVVAFAIAFQVEKTNNGNIDDPSQFIIVMNWADQSRNDIDLIVRDSHNRIVWYKAKTVVGMSLDRDDLGNGGPNDPIRREVVSIRKSSPGLYTINVLFFRNSDTNRPNEDVKVSVLKLNPYLEIYSGITRLSKVGEEKTVVSFTVNEDGSVKNADVNKQVKIVTQGALK